MLHPPRRLAAGLAYAVLLTLALGCSPGSGANSSMAATSPTPGLLERLPLALVPRTDLERDDSADEAPRVLAELSLRLDLESELEERVVEGQIPLDAAGFTQVVAELSCSRGPFDRVHLELLRGTKVVESTAQVQVQSDGQVRPVVFSVPELRQEPLPVDSFRLVILGRSGASHVESIAFIEQSGRGISLAREGLGEPRSAWGTARRAVSLLTTDEAQATVDLDTLDSVAFFVAIDPDLRRPKERLRFRARLDDLQGGGVGSVAVLEEGLLNPRDAWQKIVLTAPKDGRYRLSVQMDSTLGSGAGYGLVGEACVQRNVTLDPGAPSPLVLLITSDTHRGDHLGILSASSPVATPHLDALARRGVLFEDCFSQTNVTIPSHIALLTGTHPRDTGILDNRTRLADHAHTLAEVYAEAGYETFAATSTFHLLHEGCGLGQGFDRMVGPDVLYLDGEVAIDALLPWIDDDRGHPTFAWLHLFDAHAPYGPPKPYDRRYYGDGDPLLGEEPDLPAKVLEPIMEGLKDLSFPYQQYRAEVDYLDGALAQLLGHRRVQAGITAFTADHAHTLAEAYAEAGYETFAATSTCHLLHEGCGLGQGFDRMVGPDVLYLDGEVAIDALLPWIDDDRGHST
ncbi:MAG: sulfatase-like hydrolase/transferase, partial [Planctomycetota bacterium]